MLDDVKAGAKVEAADVGGVADGALPGLHGLGRGPGAGAQCGRPLAPPETPVQGACRHKQ